MTKSAPRLPERYRVLRTLGRGGMGEVFLVRDRTGKIGGDLALKRCRAPAGSEQRARFQREFATLAKLASPALPQVKDFGASAPDFFWFTYAYVPGEDIFTWSAHARPDELLRVARELCEVLTFLHARGVLHLDVKPSNIIVTSAPEGPRPTLIDFGIVRRFDEDDARAPLGSLPYLAPEVLRGDEPGPPADFFSLGVTLFECLFRVRPFEGASVEALRNAHAKVCPSPPATWTVGAAPEIEGLIWRLLARDPKNRLPQLEQGGRALELLVPYVRSASPIGREDSIAALYSAYCACVRGEGKTLCVLEGEAGAGKTRVLRECRRTLQIAGGAFMELRGGDLTSVTEELLAELRALGPSVRAHLQRFRRKVKEAPRRNGLASELWRQRIQEEKTRYFDSVAELLAAALAGRPTFIALDDAHRADPLSIELLAHVARRFYFARTAGGEGPKSAAPVFACLSFRSEGPADGMRERLRAELGESEFALRIVLKPLEEADVGRLLESMFGEGLVPAEVTARMHRLSGGNPFILEETLDALLGRGELQFTPRRKLVLRASRAALAMPESVDALLRARLRGVPADARMLLGTLCASPEPLAERMVPALAPFAPEETRRILRELVSMRILSMRRAPAGPLLEFSHVRLRELLYLDLQGKARRDAHRALGNALERAGASPKELAAHFIAAEDAQRGLAYVRKAEPDLKARGDTAVLRRLLEGLRPLLEPGTEAYRETCAALVETLALEGEFGAALALLSERPDTPETELERGLLHVALGERERAQTRLASARKGFAAARAPDSAQRTSALRGFVRATLGLCRLEAEGGAWDRARELAGETIGTFEKLVGARPVEREDRVLLSALHGALGSASNSRGLEETAVRHFRLSYALLARDGPSLEKAGLCVNLANMHTARAEYARAREFYGRALALARAVGARDLQTLVNANLGLLHLYQWDLDKAEEHIGEAVAIASASGSRRYAVFARFCLGVLRSRQGRLADAEEVFRAELASAKARGDRYLGMNLGVQLAYVLLDRGAAREALELCAEAMGWARETGRDRGLIESALAQGCVYAAFGAWKEAIAHLRTAHEVPGGRHPHSDAETRLYLGATQVAAGAADEGLSNIAAAAGAFRRLKIAMRVVESRVRHAFALHLAGERRKALSLVRHAWRELWAVPSERRPALLACELAVLRARIVLAGPHPASAELVEIFHELSDGAERARHEGAERLLWQALAVLARVHRAMGHEKLASEYLDAARDALARLCATLPVPLRESLQATREAAELRAERGEATRTIPRPDARAGELKIARMEESYRTLEDENRRLRQDVADLQRRVSAAGGVRGAGQPARGVPEGFVGVSAPMRELVRMIERIGPTDLAVLVTGESGTGKDRVARALHAASERRAGRLVSESCAAVPSGLWESEFFGYAKGAFTGAVADKQGLFRMAHGGTMYLDEVGDLAPELQAKLLRVLDEGRVRPLGANEYERVDFRVIASTRRDLRAEIERGTFRRDLFHRLCGVELRVPPLRERREDIPLLVDAFTRAFAGQGRNVRFSRKAVDILMSHQWPGNVRELENEVRRLVLLAGEYVAADDLALPLRERGTALLRPEAVGCWSLDEARALLEREYFRAAWEKCGGAAPEVAKLLGVHERSVYKLRRRLGLE